MFLIDPLTDPRWSALAEGHPNACAFHTRGWMQALASTYGYQPFAVCSSGPGETLADVLPVCRVESWLTGRRLVALPFTDHCQPLVAASSAASEITEYLADLARRERYRFVEIRPAHAADAIAVSNNEPVARYMAHWLDLDRPLEQVFASFDKDSIQRRIRRAEREDMSYEEGRSDDLISRFYELMVRTRRRHQLPPQPIQWFRNLAALMGDSVNFRVVSKEHAAIAAIVTLQHRNSMIYKYGCSDERYHQFGCMPLLFWKMIQDAKTAGIPLVDFGRSDRDNPGLIRFKDQWGTRRTELCYYRFPHLSTASGGRTENRNRVARAVFSHLPDVALKAVGRLVYRHIG